MDAAEQSRTIWNNLGACQLDAAGARVAARLDKRFFDPSSSEGAGALFSDPPSGRADGERRRPAVDRIVFFWPAPAAIPSSPRSSGSLVGAPRTTTKGALFLFSHRRRSGDEEDDPHAITKHEMRERRAAISRAL